MNIFKRTLFILVLIFISTALFARGNQELPDVIDLVDEPQYLSPNGDGLQDVATIDFTATVYVKSEEGYIPESSLTITDSSGSIVKQVIKTAESDMGFFKRLFSGFEAHTVEDSIEWDGTYEDGSQADDGTYTVKFKVVAASDQASTFDLPDFIVDTEAPDADIEIADEFSEYMTFSPNGDGKKDSLIINQNNGSTEVEWTGQIIDESGAVVYTETWTDSVPGEFSWDGSDSSGNTAPNGTYSYLLSSTDLAGNESDISPVTGIILDATQTGLSFAEDLEDERSRSFSPNDDGIKDTLVLTPVLDQPDLVSSWLYTLTSSARTTQPETYFEVTGNSDDFPGQIIFDGLDMNGEPIPETDLDFDLVVSYEHGNVDTLTLHQADGMNLFLDTSAPDVSLYTGTGDDSVPYEADDIEIFSPNGDSRKDTAKIKVVPGEDVDWSVALLDDTGNTVISADSSISPTLVVWNGKDADGQILPDGEYTADIVFIDYAGNSSQLERKLYIDNREVILTLDYPEGFSPNGDGNMDTFPIKISANLFEGVDTWVASFYDASDDLLPLKMYRGSTLPEQVVWNGTVDDSVSVVTEGSYLFKLDVYYEKGDLASKTGNITVEYLPPDVTITSLESNSDSVTLTGTIDDSRATVLVSVAGQSIAADVSGNKWSARVSGLSDGQYDVVAEVQDIFGNTGSDSSSNELLVDTTAPVITVTSKTVDVTQPEVSGTVDDPAADVNVTVGGRSYNASVTGNSWSISVASPLESGTYEVQATAVDALGNTGNDTSSGELIVSLAGPEIEFEHLATNKQQPMLSGGIDDPEATLQLAINGTVVDAVIDGESWTAQVDEPLAAGYYDIIFTAENANGKQTIKTESDALLIDIEPPVVEVAVTKNPFAQTDEGIEGEVYVSIQVQDDNDVASWTMDIVEKDQPVTPDNTIRSYSGEGDPSDQIAWSGEVKNDAQGQVIKEFTIIVKVTDVGGNFSEYSENVPLDVLVVKRDGKLFLMVPNIIFGAYKHTLDSKGTAMEKRNYESIDKVVEIYNRYPQFGLGLEAHALNIYEPNSERWKQEEEILLPLTERRAESVREALEDRGIEASVIVSNAYGGLYPIASTTDSSEWWKNRRVEFIMLPPGTQNEIQ